jgi:hypothetical protein
MIVGPVDRGICPIIEATDHVVRIKAMYFLHYRDASWETNENETNEQHCKRSKSSRRPVLVKQHEEPHYPLPFRS